MKRPLIYLVAPPFCGHLHPILGIARALAADFEVVVASTEKSQAAIRASGLEGEVLLAGAANISVRSEAVQHQRDRSTKMTMIKMISALMTRLLVMTTVMSVWRRGVTRGFEGWDTCQAFATSLTY